MSTLRPAMTLCRWLPPALLLGLAACSLSGGQAQVATVPHSQEYWDNLTSDHSEPRVDYPGPAIHGNTGMGSGDGGGM